MWPSTASMAMRPCLTSNLRRSSNLFWSAFIRRPRGSQRPSGAWTPISCDTWVGTSRIVVRIDLTRFSADAQLWSGQLLWCSADCTWMISSWWQTLSNEAICRDDFAIARPAGAKAATDAMRDTRRESLNMFKFMMILLFRSLLLLTELMRCLYSCIGYHCFPLLGQVKSSAVSMLPCPALWLVHITSFHRSLPCWTWRQIPNQIMTGEFIWIILRHPYCTVRGTVKPRETVPWFFECVLCCAALVLVCGVWFLSASRKVTTSAAVPPSIRLLLDFWSGLT